MNLSAPTRPGAIRCPVCMRAIGIDPLATAIDQDAYVCDCCGASHRRGPEAGAADVARVRGHSNGQGDDEIPRHARVVYELSNTRLGEILGVLPVSDGLSLLDIGCGDGALLNFAHERGWKCFGVETSATLRARARERLGQGVSVVRAIDDLVPHEFSVILLLDQIEQFESPYPLFYALFAKGAIGRDTKLVIGARGPLLCDASGAARNSGGNDEPQWRIVYPESALRALLRRLRFGSIDVEPMRIASPGNGNGDSLERADTLAIATGSDFAEFMRERYVPGTWSRIAEYEHMPRYSLAAAIGKGGRVLDFGCGTGYGSAMLASTAKSVVGLDIDPGAIEWANETHSASALNFICRDDLAESLPANSFDLVTCFEMIEHVDHATQIATVSSLGRVLRDDGFLVISTPNPDVTALYGENTFHVREMSRAEFLELLSPYFPHIRILEQRIRNSVSFEGSYADSALRPASLRATRQASDCVAFVAVCSRREIGDLPEMVFFDNETDFVRDYLAREEDLNALRYESYRLGESVQNLQAAVEGGSSESSRSAAIRELLSTTLADKRRLEELMFAKDKSLAETRAALVSTQTDLRVLRETKWFQLRDALIRGRWSIGKVGGVAWLLLTLATPLRVRRRLAESGVRLRRRYDVFRGRKNPLANAPAPHKVHIQTPIAAGRGRVVHVIANFMTGGSSRLVVDLIEHLSENFEQSVVTSFIPTPPAYTGLPIAEFRRPDDESVFIRHFRELAPDFIHVHYWGDCDDPWYALAIRGAEIAGIPLIQNVNTPVAPFSSARLVRCVYVSDYVRTTFGGNRSSGLTIHPGSDFSRFDRADSDPVPGDCVGMVYRLEKDKLDERAIDPFIRIAQLRPQTRILIVGGGTLLRVFQRAVLAAGVADRFEFTGYVSYDLLPQLYRRLSVFIAPVWKESFGQVSAFAMNMRIPVVGYDVGAIAEIVDDPALIAPAADSERLARIAIELLDSRELTKNVGRRQQARARELFSLQAMCAKYADLYADVYREQRSKAQ